MRMNFLKIKRLNKQYLLSFTNITLLLLILNLLHGNLGCYEPYLMRTTAFLLMMLSTTITIKPSHLKHLQKNILIPAVLLLISSFIILFQTKNQLIWLMSTSAWASSLLLLTIKTERKELPFFLKMSILYTIFAIFVETLPTVWLSIQHFSYIFTTIIGKLIGKEMIYGPSVSGLWILIMFFLFYFLIFIHDKKKIRFSIATISLILTWIFYLTVRAYLPLFQHEISAFKNQTLAINSQIILFLTLLIPTAIYYLKSYNIPSYKPQKSTSNLYSHLRNPKLASIITLLIVSLFITLIFVPSADNGTVLFYQKDMLGTWDKPEYGRYGEHAAGMFGLLPEYLNHFGYSTVVTNTSINEKILDQITTLVIINPSQTFSADEKEVIWDFVARGGSLLVLGDHTDIGGIKKPLDTLLEPVGIKFNFDSALPTTDNWVNSIQILYNKIGFDVDRNLVGWSVGASLDLSGESFPIVVARYAFSDHGNYLNTERAFLGDYTYNKNEEFGDLVLVAGAFYGEGKVLVFGDTTSFQNPSIPEAHRFVYNVFEWLNGRDNSSFYLIKTIASVILFLTYFGALLLLFRKTGFFITLSVILLATFIVVVVVNSCIVGEETIGGERLAYIDASHIEKFNIIGYNDGSLTGFMTSLGRNRYFPFIFTDFVSNRLSNYKILVLVTPTEAFSEEEVHEVEEFMREGGLVVLSCGYSTKDAVDLLLQDLCIDISDIPLGPVPYIEENPDAFKDEPRFVGAYPIIYNGTDVEAFYNVTIENRTYTIVVFKHYGLGGMLFIADEQFLLDKNLEGAYDYWPGNIEFLRSIFQKLEAEGIPR